MGLLNQSDWAAKWIQDPGYTYATNGVPNPLPIFGKTFDAAGRIAKARLYVTGLGQYAARLNGRPVSRAVLEPGQTSYWAEVDYRTYDVTGLLRPGSNVLGIETGSGVYQQADSTPMGRYMFQPGNNVVMGAPKVIAQLEITFADGRTQTIATDPSWVTRARRHDVLVLVGRRGLRRPADRAELDRLAAQPCRPRLAARRPCAVDVLNDSSRHDPAGRRSATSGDGGRRRASGEHHPGDATG